MMVQVHRPYPAGLTSQLLGSLLMLGSISVELRLLDDEGHRTSISWGFTQINPPVRHHRAALSCDIGLFLGA